MKCIVFFPLVELLPNCQFFCQFFLTVFCKVGRKKCHPSENFMRSFGILFLSSRRGSWSEMNTNCQFFLCTILQSRQEKKLPSWREEIHASFKVIHPKYYKHLKKGAHQSHLGRQKMGWCLAD